MALTRLSFTLHRINTPRRTNKAQRRQTVAFNGEMQAQTDVNVRSPQKYIAWSERNMQDEPKIRSDAAPVASRVKSNPHNFTGEGVCDKWYVCKTLTIRSKIANDF